MNYLARIESLHPDIIEHFIENGISKAIPEDLQLIISQLTWSVLQATHQRFKALFQCRLYRFK